MVEEKNAVTFFITSRWLQHNQPAMDIMPAHTHLFQIENHGARHVPAITTVATMYDSKTAGSLDADMGAWVSAGSTEKRILNARDGDVIIVHVNQPTSQAVKAVNVSQTLF